MKRSTRYVHASVALVVLMVIIVIGSFAFFQIKTKQLASNTLDVAEKYYDRHYVLITDGINTRFWESVYEGAKAYGEEHGSFVELLGNTTGESYDCQGLLKKAIAENVDGIIVMPDQTAGTGRLIDEAVDLGIPVVTVYQDHTDSKRISYVGVSNYNMGTLYGNQLCACAEKIFFKNYNLPDEEKKHMVNALVLMSADAADTSESILFSGIQNAVKKNEKYASRIQINTLAINTRGTFSAEESIRDIFMNTSSLPDIIICLDELNTACAYQALIDYNKVGQMHVIGFYQSDTILKALQRKAVTSTITVDTNQMGAYSVEALDEYVSGGYVSDYYSVDTSVIYPDNANKYMEEAHNEQAMEEP